MKIIKTAQFEELGLEVGNEEHALHDPFHPEAHDEHADPAVHDDLGATDDLDGIHDEIGGHGDIGGHNDVSGAEPEAINVVDSLLGGGGEGGMGDNLIDQIGQELGAGGVDADPAAGGSLELDFHVDGDHAGQHGGMEGAPLDIEINGNELGMDTDHAFSDGLGHDGEPSGQFDEMSFDGNLDGELDMGDDGLMGDDADELNFDDGLDAGSHGHGHVVDENEDHDKNMLGPTSSPIL